jgi:hypothetical protein
LLGLGSGRSSGSLPRFSNMGFDWVTSEMVRVTAGRNPAVVGNVTYQLKSFDSEKLSW